MDFYRDVLGSPQLVVAPMVDASELAWRMLSKFFSHVPFRLKSWYCGYGSYWMKALDR